MEANFTLITRKQQLTFLGKISEGKQRNVFKIENPMFLQMVDVLLGEEYMKSEYKYQTNVDIASLFLAWCLNLGNKQDVH